MDALIYTAMSGANRALHAQQVHANNIANVETRGFRADIEMADSQAVKGYGYDSRHMPSLQANAVDGRAGTLTATGRELDVAIKGDGYFAVEIAGKEAYTRAGSLVVDRDGALLLNGHPVLGAGGAITLPPFAKVEISANGTIAILPAGETELQDVDRLKTVTLPAGEATKNEAGLLVRRDGRNADAGDDLEVASGHLEASNVSAVEEMVATMSLNRSFEMQMKLLRSADDLADAGNRLMRA
ncbi:flagellar basal body rod protein FlgF [Paludibacterium paludis]|uniref:Flagellar basal-body rod protein FlgF n=1 Tax=Paludibacterium paludis TaxID=1225769 RepID=A0A918U7J9_9NEIS|nr:flagellar basal body rod protein FlgF [Paludibacterium paludis]GGY04797.1 flagellar basal body protein [Paludibacterium paludis]